MPCEDFVSEKMLQILTTIGVWQEGGIHKDFLRSSDDVKGDDPSYTQVLHNMQFRHSTDNSRRMPLTSSSSSSNQLFACPLSLVSQAKHVQIMVNTRQ